MEQKQNPEPWWPLGWAWCFRGIAGRAGSLEWKQLERKCVSRASQRVWNKRFCRLAEGLRVWVLLQCRALSRGAAWSVTYLCSICNVLHLPVWYAFLKEIYQFDIYLFKRKFHPCPNSKWHIELAKRVHLAVFHKIKDTFFIFTKYLYWFGYFEYVSYLPRGRTLMVLN